MPMEFSFASLQCHEKQGLGQLIAISRQATPEPPGHSLHVGFIQCFIGTCQPTAPATKAARITSQGVISVEDDAVNAVVNAVQQVLIVGCEIVGGSHSDSYDILKCVISTGLRRSPIFLRRSPGKT